MSLIEVWREKTNKFLEDGVLLNRLYNDLINWIHEQYGFDDYADDSLDSIDVKLKSYIFKEYKSYFEQVNLCDLKEFQEHCYMHIFDRERSHWREIARDAIKMELDRSEFDSARDELIEICNNTLRKAMTIKAYGTVINNDQEYTNLNRRIAKLYAKVKPWNKAKLYECMSEALTEMNYIYGKSTNESARMNQEIIGGHEG